MGDIILSYLLINVLIFGLIFWGLTWGAEYFFKKKIHSTKKQFYECGFKSTAELNVQINLNFSMLCVFLVLYDVEFTMLFPVLFNFGAVSFFEYIVFLGFVGLIVLSLIYDWQMHTLNWYY